jgi:two-component system OmpR family response regulator
MTDHHSGPAGGGRVLVADNDGMIANVLRALLMRVGQLVDMASTTDEVLRLSDINAYELMTLDLDMPTDGGLLVCRKLREAPRSAETPIVILTAQDEAETRALCMAAGATLFVAKPFNPAELMRRLEPYLRVPPSHAEALAGIMAVDRGLQLSDASSKRRT